MVWFIAPASAGIFLYLKGSIIEIEEPVPLPAGEFFTHLLAYDAKKLTAEISRYSRHFDARLE